jgi:hypothetical protein
MTIAERLTAADLDAICQQIADGFAARDSSSMRTAGGYDREDCFREYFCHLPDPNGQTWRVARVTTNRDPVGRWTIGDVDIFTTTTNRDTIARDNVAAADILAAVESDNRTIARVA